MIKSPLVKFNGCAKCEDNNRHMYAHMYVYEINHPQGRGVCISPLLLHHSGVRNIQGHLQQKFMLQFMQGRLLHVNLNLLPGIYFIKICVTTENS